jgi:pyrroloquinoline quinone biosynthesis protein E
VTRAAALDARARVDVSALTRNRQGRDRLYANPAPALPPGYVAPAGMQPIRLHELDLYVTMACNIRCDFCNVRAGEYRHRDLPLARIRSLLDEAAALGLRECHLLGGEPTLRRDLEDIIAHAAGLGLHTRIISNGMLLGRARIRSLIDAGLHEVMISVDGNEDTHNRLRRAAPDGWRLTMRAVRECIDLGLRTRVSMVAYDDNYDEVTDVLRTSERLGAHIFSCFLGSPLGRGETRPGRVVSPHRWRALQDRLGELAAGMRPDLQIVVEQGFAWRDGMAVDRTQLKGRGTGCNTLLEDYDYLIVRSDGNLYQCVFFMTDGKPIGNIAHQPLKKTLQHALELREYEAFTHANDRCTSCHHQSECGTGCRGYAYLYKNDWLRTDPRCSKDAPQDAAAPEYYPLCPIMKLNVRSRLLGGSTEQALERSVTTA